MLSVTFLTVNVGTPDEDDPLAPVPTVACTDTRFIPVNAGGIRKYALSDVVRAVVPLSEVATYFIPKLEPARPSGVNARVVSVPVFVSAIVASSTAPVTVSLALRYVFVALDMSLFVRVSVLLTVGTFTHHTWNLPVHFGTTFIFMLLDDPVAVLVIVPVPPDN